ncbi:MAG: hypothetical protein V1659_03810 [Candidatus Woesearchaeota archaeon]
MNEKKRQDSVYVVRVARHPLSDRLSFPSDDEKIFAVSNMAVYETVPDSVHSVFRSKPKMERLENPDWIWSLRGGLKTGFYVRQENQREKVIKGLEDYFSSLEKLKGADVLFSRLFPAFPRNEDFDGFNIPETSYFLRYMTAPGFLGVQLVGNDFMIHYPVGDIFYAVK